MLPRGTVTFLPLGFNIIDKSWLMGAEVTYDPCWMRQGELTLILSSNNSDREAEMELSR